MKCLEIITNNFLTNFENQLKLLAGLVKKGKFQEKTTMILNDVAEVVLKWNLGAISNDEAMSRINKAFAKQDFFNSP